MLGQRSRMGARILGSALMELSYGQRYLIQLVHDSAAPHRFGNVHNDSDMCMDLMYSNLKRLERRGYITITNGVYGLTEQGKEAIHVV